MAPKCLLLSSPHDALQELALLEGGGEAAPPGGLPQPRHVVEGAEHAQPAVHPAVRLHALEGLLRVVQRLGRRVQAQVLKPWGTIQQIRY